MSTDVNGKPAQENFAWQSIVGFRNKYLGEVTKERIAIGWSQATRLRVGVLAILIAIAADYLWLQPDGFAGYAAFLLTILIVLALELHLAQRLQSTSLSTGNRLLCVVVSTAIVIACIRMIWQGNTMIAILGTVLLSVFCLVSRDQSIGVARAFSNLFRSVFDGVVGWSAVLTNLPPIGRSSRRFNWISWVIPLVVAAVFLYPLLAAHPDLLKSLREKYDAILQSIFDWLVNWSISRMTLLAVIATMAFGLMTPLRCVFVRYVTRDRQTIEPCSSVLYQSYRNSLLSVIVVFFVFLVVEFVTLWIGDLPKGFSYVAYAHQGAAWLVVALMMATLMMSVIFNSAVQARPEAKLLRTLAWIWFVANLLLVVAVYHRLGIYVSYNGLTRLRIVGYVGVTCVLAGFVVVMFRVTHLRSVLWVIQRQAWAFFISVFVLSVLPMDWVAQRWNVARVQKGDYAPIDHFVLQTISAEGLLALAPLVDSENPVIRNGVLAIISKATFHYDVDDFSSSTRGAHLGRQSDSDDQKNWRLFQWSQYRLDQFLAKHQADMQQLDGRWEMAIQELRQLSARSH